MERVDVEVVLFGSAVLMHAIDLASEVVVIWRRDRGFWFSSKDTGQVEQQHKQHGEY